MRGRIPIVLFVLLFSVISPSVLGLSPIGNWTYSWQSNPSPFVLRTQVINGVGGDAHQDLFVVADSGYSYSNNQLTEYPAELLFLNGTNGSTIRSVSLGQVTLTDGLSLGNVEVAAEYSGLLIGYDLNLTQIWSRNFTASIAVMRDAGGLKLVIADGCNVTALDASNGKTIWTWTAPSTVLDTLVMGNSTVCYYAGNLTLLNANGNLLCNLSVQGAGFTETFCRLDNDSFLMLEVPSLIKFQISHNSFSQDWKIEVGAGSANKPLVVPDLDGDGLNDFICRTNGTESLALFSGGTGNMLHYIGISAMYISAGCILDQPDSNGTLEVAIAPYSSSTFHGLYIVALDKRNATSVSIDGVDLFSSACPIQGVKNSNISNVVATDEQGNIYYYSGSNSQIPEFSALVFLAFIIIIPTAIVTKKTRARARKSRQHY